MPGKPRTIGGWAKKLYMMKGGKLEVIIIGWTTPLKTTRKFWASMGDVPKSATTVRIALRRKNGGTSRPFDIARDRLSKEFYV